MQMSARNTGSRFQNVVDSNIFLDILEGSIVLAVFNGLPAIIEQEIERTGVIHGRVCKGHWNQVGAKVRVMLNEYKRSFDQARERK